MDTNTPEVDPIRVLVVDDHEVSRRGLVFALSLEGDMQSVGEASSGAETITRVRELDGGVDVIVMDVQMSSPTDGIDTTAKVHAEWPECRVLLLTSSEQHAPAAMRAGATGYVLKGSPVQDVLTAIRTVHKGTFYFEVAPHTDIMLTDTELVILDLIADSLSNGEIAERLKVSPRSVTTHVSALLSKLGAVGREQAVRFGMRRGFIR